MDEEALRIWGERTNEIMETLLEKDPTLHPLTASVIANDILSAEHRTKMVEDGRKAEDMVWLVGSYARWDWAVTMVHAGKLSPEWFTENIADLWRGSDPDDTNPENLTVWRSAFASRGGMIRDGRPLPKSKSLDGTLKVFRGGHPNTVLDGFSWTLDPKVAKKFALTLGGRVPVPGGVVMTAQVRPLNVLAYLTGRGESEVITPPRHLLNVRPLRKEIA